MRLTSAGELCVGRTSAYGAGFLVNVEGNIYASAAIVAGSSGLFSGNLQTNAVLTIGNQFVAGNYCLQITPSTTTPIALQGILAGVGISDIVMQPSGGNVGIGTTAPQLNGNAGTFTTIYNASASGWLELATGSTTDGIGGSITFNNTNISGADKRNAQISGIRDGANNSAALTFITWNAGSGAERMRISSGGWLKASNNGSYHFAANDFHSIESSIGDWTCAIANKNSSSPNGIIITYTSAAPNNFSNNFLYAADNSAARFQVFSNGGIANFQANNTNLSDIRTKKDITPLGSYWDKFKAIEMVKFKYKDQTHDDFNIGVIAQQLEKVAPEFVDVDGWGDTPKDGVPLKSIYTADLHHATIKVLQEAMAKIEDLQNQ
jgi:hypothetical protein